VKYSKNSRYTSFPAGPVYLDEIEHALKLLADKSESVRIEVGDYTFDSLDEIRERRGESVEQLSLQSTNPDVSITLVPKTYIAVHSHGIDDRTDALFFAVAQVFSNRHLPRYRLAMPVLAMGLFLSAFAVPRFYTGPAPGIVSLAAAVILTGFSYLIIFRYASPQYRILLTRRHQQRSFVKRHEENFVTGGIGMIGAAIGALFTYWLTK